MGKRKLLLPLRLLISGGLIVFLIWKANPLKIWQSWQGIDWAWLVVALLLQFVGVAVSAAKWGMLLRANGERLPYRWLLGAYLAGQFANNFLPTTVGGDALRIAQLGRRIQSYAHASASVFLDRLTGFLALSLIASAVLLLRLAGLPAAQFETQPALIWMAVAFTLVSMGALAVALSTVQLRPLLESSLIPAFLRRPARKVADVLERYSPRGAALTNVLLVSLVFQTIWMLVHVACGWALGFTGVPLLVYALMVPLTDMLGLAPIFFNNLGARETIFILYLTRLGYTSDQAIALSLLVFSVRLVVSVLGGLVILFGGADLRARMPAATSDT
ncbi:MAG TPA: lysylphosphatidylglycerol synthase transmembrane domain-containing protein [Roseiflexaceae bacterium]|jgi:uncharacterized protein (TIRG00374 family)|nr:lysylphosphatidylglycerol synthase transmembrane domain-containing protein [Roseiflexaceae bacterium]